MNNKQLGKVAIVTGAAVGLGREIALSLAKEGFTIAAHFHKSEKEAKELLAEISKVSPESSIFGADLKDKEQVLAFASSVLKKYSKVDVLVNNVGNFLYKKFANTTNAEFMDVLESNVYSTLFCSRAFLSLMRKQKSGNIVNIGSVGAERIILRAKSTPYFIAKTAVYSLTKAMANEEAKFGIRINMISPASMSTDIFKNSDFPMGRSAKYDDVVKVLLFLISEDAHYINGANVEVAGGFIPGF